MSKNQKNLTYYRIYPIILWFFNIKSKNRVDTAFTQDYCFFAKTATLILVAFILLRENQDYPL